MTDRAEVNPNPGSEAAQKLGCTCAVLDNNHGRFAPWPPNGWWITGGCPVHAPHSQKRVYRRNEPVR